MVLIGYLVQNGECTTFSSTLGGSLCMNSGMMPRFGFQICTAPTIGFGPAHYHGAFILMSQIQTEQANEIKGTQVEGC